MPSGTKVLAVLCLCCSALLPGRAQTPPPLPVHTVRSISPTDTDFSDLEFLTREIGAARVVMLGEPTHGEGNVLEAKIRLLRFLQQKMGFTTVAFESGFYDLHKAQQALEAGKSAEEALDNSVFPVWTSTQEFQAVLPLVGKSGLRVAGFDPQLSGAYGEELVEDLQAFLAPQKAGSVLNYDYLDEVIGFMGEQFAFLPTTKLADFEKELAKAVRLVDKAAASSDARRRTEAALWQQNLRSLLAQARDYAAHDPGAKLEEQFVAIDSNPRDAQMADNLLWYLRQHPQEKVVCWAALLHLANRTGHFGNPEMQAYRPMGRAVKEALGPGQVYILGTLAGGGTHGFPAEGYQPVPAPAAGSLEAGLLAQPANYAFVSLKHDAPGQQLITYAFDYQPLAGPWSEAVDGFLFLRSVNPPHGVAAVVAAVPTATDSALARTVPTALNPAGRLRRVRAAAGTATVHGVVLDHKTGQPVPYASVSMPAQRIGTVADGQGRFVLHSNGGAVQVSSVGYTVATLMAPAAGPLTVRLAPAAYELAGVQVHGESLDPRKIMKKVLAALPQNYEQDDYVAEVYTHRRLSNFDTLRYEAEYVSQVVEPAGYRNFTAGFLGLGPREKHRVREVQVLTKPKTPMGWFDLSAGGQGFYTAAADPVRTVPLFKPGTWRRFTLHLDSVQQQGDETVYVLSFVARHANHRSTGTYLTGRLSGRFYVQQRDYAVQRYQALWEHDTLTMNAIARQHAGRHDRIAPLYNTVYSDDRTDHFVEYERGVNGRYHVAYSVAQAVSAGRVLGKAPHHHQVVCEEYFRPLPAKTLPLPPDPKLDPRWADDEIYQLYRATPHPEFWQTYQRPDKAAAVTPSR